MTKTPGTVAVAGLASEGDELPDGEVILFLMNHARQREEGGYAPADDPDDIYHYERPNGYQCVLRNTDGVVEIVQGPRGAEEVFGPFPWVLDGEPFEEIADRIREIAAESE